MVAIVSGNSLGLSLSSASLLGQQGTIGSSNQGRSGEQAFVNVATGNLVLQRRDEYLASQGDDINLVRTYNSRGLMNDENGDNWSYGPFNQPLSLTGGINTAGSTIRRTAPDGAQSLFTFNAARGLYVTTDGDGAHDTIWFDSPRNQFLWRDWSSGAHERYDAAAANRLRWRQDAAGIVTSYHLNGAGQLAAITSASGDIARYEYVGNNVVEIRAFDPNGVMSTRTRYAYDTENRLTKVTIDLTPADNNIADGKIYETHYTYDGLSKRVASVVQTDKTRLDITYVEVGNEFRVASVRDALGHLTTYSYDVANRKTTVTDPLGVVSRYGYDAEGRLLNVQGGIVPGKPFGLSQLYYAYDAAGNVASITDGFGKAITFQYDSNGNRTLKQDSLGNTVVSTYDSNNQLLTETVAGGSDGSGATSLSLTSRYVYDAAGKHQLRFSISAEGRVTRHKYDETFGNKVSSTEYGALYSLAGLTSTQAPTQAQMETWADAQDLAQTSRTDWGYDFRGQIESSTTYAVINGAGVGSSPATTRYIWSQAGELLKTITPHGHETVAAYDGLGREIVKTAPSSDGTIANTTITDYFDDQARTKVTIANGLSTMSSYDNAGRLTSVVQSSAGGSFGSTTYAYDAANRLTMTQDPTGVRRWMVYDEAGRKVAEVDGTGAATEFAYNVNGQLTQTISYAKRLTALAGATIEPVSLPSVGFDPLAYVASYADLRAAIGANADAALQHYANHGQAEGRQVTFDPLNYLATYPELGLGTDTVAASRHYIEHGAAEGRAPSFDAFAYLASYRDLQVAFGSNARAATMHYIQHGAAEGRSIRFDGLSYLASHADLRGVFGTDARAAAQHYVQSGQYEGRTVTFNPISYLASHSDLAQVFGTDAAAATLHYLQSGAAEGRTIRADAPSIIASNAALRSAYYAWVGSHSIAATVAPTLAVIRGLAGAEDRSSWNVYDAAQRLVWQVDALGYVTQFEYDGASRVVSSTRLATPISASVLGNATNVLAAGGTLTTASLPDIAQSAVVVQPTQSRLMLGSPATFTARIIGADTNGQVQFFSGPTLIGSATVVDGLATVTVSGLSVAHHPISARFSGNATTAASTSASVNVTVIQQASVSVAVNAAQTAEGSATTFTATVSGAAPAGTVTFFEGNTPLGSAPVVVNGGVATATFTTTSLALGLRNVTAVYSGDALNAEAVSSATASVRVVAGSTTTLVTSEAQVTSGMAVTVTATVAPGAGQPQPTGTVSFYDGNTLLGTVSVTNGTASFTTVSLSAGSHSISAVYSGDSNSASSTSATLGQIVLALPGTITKFGASHESVSSGGLLFLGASVSVVGGGPATTGTVTFYDGDQVVGTSGLDGGGNAGVTLTGVPAGSHNYRAVYAGTASLAASTSASKTIQSVAGGVSVPASLGAGTTLALVASAGSISLGGSVTLTATVGASSATGTVTFVAGSTILGTAPVVNGVATLTTSGLPPGSNGVSASYSGNGSYAPAVSVQSVLVNVTPPATTFVITSSTATAVKNSPVSFVVHLAGANPLTPPSGLVDFFCNGAGFATAAVVNGVATLSTTALDVGSNSITVQYHGDANNAAGTSAVFNQQVVAAPATVTLTTATSTAVIGTPVTLNASVAGASPTGMVTFFHGQTSLGTAPIANGVASLSVTFGIAGIQSLTAVYAGDANNASGVAAAMPLSVSALDSPVSLSTSASSVNPGAAVTLTASVPQTWQNAVLTGVTTFNNGSSAMQPTDAPWGVSGSVSSTVGYTGGASVSWMPGGWYDQVHVGLNTDPGTDNASGSMDWAVMANQGWLIAFESGVSVMIGEYTWGDVLSITYDGSHIRYLKNGGLLRQVAANITQPLYLDTSFNRPGSVVHALQFKNAAGQTHPLTNPPLGNITFFDGQTNLGTASLVNGVASLTTSALTRPGVANVTAVYSGDTLHPAAASAAAAVTVVGPLSLSASSTNIAAGGAVTLTAQMAAQGSLQDVLTSTGMTVSGNTATKSGAAGWNSSVRSSVGYSGGARVSFTPQQTNKALMLGLNTDPASSDSYESIDWAIYCINNGSLSLFKNGAQVASPGQYAAGDALEIVYEGGYVRFLKNGTVMYQEAATITEPLYLDSSFYDTGAQVGNLQFGTGPRTVTFFNGQTRLGSATVASNGTATLTTNALTVSGTAYLTAVGGDPANPGFRSEAVAIAVTGGSSEAPPASPVSLSTSASSVNPGAAVTLTASVPQTWQNAVLTGVTTFNNGSSAMQPTDAPWGVSGSVSSTVGYTGGASVSWMPGGWYDQVHVGLNTDPGTDNASGSMDWAVMANQGWLIAFESGVSVMIGEYTWGDVLSITYDGSHIRYLKNGGLLRQVAANITQPLYLDTSFNRPGSVVHALQFKNAAGQTHPLTNPPLGNITFFDGQTNLGTASLVNGVASLTTSALTRPGVANVTAVYSGDTLHPAAASAAAAVTVVGPLSLSASSTNIAAGGAVTLTAQMAAQGSLQDVLTSTGMTVSGNTATKSGAAGWNSSVRSSVGYSGGARVSFTPQQTNKALMLGLNTDPASSDSYESIDWAIYCINNGSLSLFKNGAQVASPGQYAAGDALEIVYEGGYVRFLKNGTVMYQEAATITEPLYLDSSFYDTGAQVGNLQFGTGPRTVTFFNGQTRLGSATVASNGTATLTTNALTVSGTAYLTAVGGDPAIPGFRSGQVAISVAGLIGGASTTTGLTASPAPSSAGQPITLTATVSGGSSVTGTVTFFNGTVALGAASVVNGTASFVARGLPAGNQTLKAVYSGDTTSASSASSAVNAPVAKAASAVSLRTSVPGPQGRVWATATVDGVNPSGLVRFYRNGSYIGIAQVTNGVAFCQIDNVPVGESANFHAEYEGDASNTSATSSVGALMVKRAPTLTLSPPPGPIYFVQPIVLSAQIDGAGSVPGTVSFYEGSTLVGSSVVDAQGRASITVTPTPGAHTITAHFSGNTTTEPVAASSVISFTVQPAPTTVAVTASRSTTPLGSTVVVNAVVAARGVAAGVGGTVYLYRNGVHIHTSSVSNGVATFTLPNLGAGTQAYTATFVANGSFAGSSTAGAANVTVLTAPSTIALSSSSPTASLGQAVTLTAQVTGSSPNGTVTFTDGETVLGTAAVTNGVASLVVGSLAAGAHNLRATYGGNAQNSASTSAVVAQRVASAASSVLSRTSASSVAQNGSIVIAVTGSNPSGLVTLYNGSVVVTTASVVNGIATLSASKLPVGALNLTAAYGGDATNPSGAVQFAQTVTGSLVTTVTILGATPTRTANGFGLLLSARVDGFNPTGTITFSDGTTTFGAVPLAYGTASILIESPLPAVNLLRGTYSGDAANAASTSAALAVPASSPLAGLTVDTYDRALHQVYDKDGLLRGTVDAEGFLTEYKYNAKGQRFMSVQYANPISGFTGPGSLAARLAAARQNGTLDDLRPVAAPLDRHTSCFYDGRGQIIGELDAEGYLTRHTYDSNGNLTLTTRHIRAVALHPSLVTATTRLDNPHLIPQVRSEDRSTQRSYDALNRLIQEVDADGLVTQYRYDSVGNLIETVRSAVGGADERKQAAWYDVRGRMTGELSAVGAALLSAGQLSVEAAWAQHGTHHAYDETGRRISTTDANGNKTLFFYDAESRLTHTVNALGEVTRRAYNAFGQVESETQLATRISMAGLAGGLATSTLTNAIAGALDAMRDGYSAFAYYKTGKLASSTDSSAAGGHVPLTTIHAYNAFGESSQRVELLPVGASTTRTFLYNRRGELVYDTSDAAGIAATKITYYDAFGHAGAQRDANGNWEYRNHDRLGREVLHVDRLGSQRSTGYDVFNRVVLQTNALQQTTSYTYNRAARSVAVTTPEGVTVTTFQTVHGQTQKVVDGLNNTTEFTYDKNGNLKTTLTPLGTGTVNSYDAANRLIETTDARGVKTALTYDAANRVLTRTTDPSGLALTTHYHYDDALGRRLEVTDPNGTVTRFEYDREGQLKRQIVDPSGLNLVTAYNYDALGNALSVTDPNDVVTVYTYDKLGRRESEVVDPTGLNLQKSYTYDDNGNVVRSIDANDQRTLYVYDEEDRLVFTIDAENGVTENVRDAEGRIASTRKYAIPLIAANIPGTPTVQSIRSILQGGDDLRPDQIENFVYGADGRVKATVNGNGDVVTFRRDAAGRVIEKRAYANSLTNWNPSIDPTVAANGPYIGTYSVYDALGRERFAIDGMGAVTRQIFDANGNVVDRMVYDRTLDLAAQALPLHPTEADIQTRLVATPDKDTVTRYAYDAANRLTGVADALGGVTRMAYDKNGNVVQTIRHATALTAQQMLAWPTVVPAGTGSDQVTRQFYDKANRLARSIDAIGAVTDFAYDRNGNVLRQTQYARTLGLSYLSQVANAGQAWMVASEPIADDADRTARTVYDAANREAFRIDPEGALTEMRYDPTGNLILSRRYKVALSGSQLAQLDGLSMQTGRPTRSDLAAMVPETIGEDRTTRQYFDHAGRLRFVRDAKLYLKEFQYDGVGRLVRSSAYAPLQMGDNHAEIYGNTGWVPYPGIVGGLLDRHETLVYDKAGHLRESMDAAGNKEIHAHDGMGRKFAFTNKAGKTWNYKYDAAYRLTEEESPLVSVTRYDNGNPVTETVHIYTRMSYDSRGNLRERIEAADRPEERKTEYRYDGLGRQTEVIHESVKTYVDEGAALATNGASGLAAHSESLHAIHTKTVYDALGNAFASKDAAGNWSFKTYDMAGRVAHELDALGYVTSYTRNAFGEAEKLVRHAQKATLTLSTSEATAESHLRLHMAAKDSTLDRELLNTYDRAGRVLQVTEPAVFNFDSGPNRPIFVASKVTRNAYNTFGELQKVSLRRNPALGDGTPELWVDTAKHWYDMLGRVTHTVDALKYLTTQTYDAFGNVATRTEHAEKSTETGALGRPVAVNSNQDRTTRYTYDALNNKVLEERLNVRNSYTDVMGNLVTQTSTVTTSYGYDRLGNLASTTDESGTTRSYYDALGRVSAVLQPGRQIDIAGAVSQFRAPLTEFKRDALGNVLVTIDRARGASANSTNEGLVEVEEDIANDRESRAVYDKLGHVIESQDAIGNKTYNSYDAQGNLRKTWQRVTQKLEDVTVSETTVFRAFQYDALGRQVMAIDPYDNGGTADLSYTSTEYNGFGEVTKRGTAGVAGFEYFHYDNAGRVWRTNEGDGVDKIYLYDARGNRTGKTLGVTQDLKLLADAVQFVNAAGASPSAYRGTEYVYDDAGRLTDTIEAARIHDTQLPVWINESEAIVVAVGDSTMNVDANGGHPITNSAVIQYPALQNLGGGDLKIELRYEPVQWAHYGNNEGGNANEPPAGPLPEMTQIAYVTPNETQFSSTMRWADSGDWLGISKIKGVKISKKNLLGNWDVIVDKNASTPSTSTSFNIGFHIDVGYANEIASMTVLEVRRLEGGVPGAWNTVSTQYQTGYGSAHRFSLEHLRPSSGEHTYEYRVTNSTLSGVVQTGQFTLKPALSASTVSNFPRSFAVLESTTDIINGSLHRVLRWNAQPAGTLVRFERHLGGDNWVEHTVYTSGDGRIDAPAGKQEAAIDIAGSGTFNYRLTFVHPDQPGMPGYATYATGTYTVDVPAGSNVEVPTVYPPVQGVQYATGKVHQSIYRVLTWDKPAAGTVTFEYRVKGSGQAFTPKQTYQYSANPPELEVNLQASNEAHNKQGVPLNLFSNEWYEFRIVHTNGSEIRETRGTFFSPPTPAWTDATNYVPNSWVFTNQGVEGYIFSSPGDGRVALERYLRTNDNYSQVWYHLYTTTNEVANHPDWQHEPGHSPGYVYTWQAPGTTRLYRLSYPYSSRHIHTINPAEVSALTGAGWVLESDVHVYVSATPVAGTTPLYRAVRHDGYSQDQLYYTSEENRAIVLATTSPATAPNTAAGDPKFTQFDVSMAQISGSPYRVLNWTQNAPDMRVTVTRTGPNGMTTVPTVHYPGDGFGTQLGIYRSHAVVLNGEVGTHIYQFIADYPMQDGKTRQERVTVRVVVGPEGSQMPTMEVMEPVPDVRMGADVLDGTPYETLQWQAGPVGSTTLRIREENSSVWQTLEIFRPGDGRSSGPANTDQGGIGAYPRDRTYVYELSRTLPDGRKQYTAGRFNMKTKAVATTLDTSQSAFTSLYTHAADPAGERPAVHFERDRWGNVLATNDIRKAWSTTGAVDWRSTFEYDANNQVVMQTISADEAPATSRFYYDKLGRQIGMQDANGNVTRRLYDSAGNVTKEVDAEGAAVDHTYNAFGDKTSTTALVGDAATQHQVKTNYTYDKMSRLAATILDGAGVDVASVDVSAVDAAGAKNRMQGFYLSGAGNTDAMNGMVMLYAKQNLIQFTQYDEAGRVVAKLTDGRVANDLSIKHEFTRYEYDRRGNLQQASHGSKDDVNAKKLTVNYTYDQAGHKTSETNLLNHKKTWAQDYFGKTTLYRDFTLNPDGSPSYFDVTYEFDYAGQVQRQRTNGSLDLTYTYDGAGQVKKIDDARLNKFTAYTYDLAGRHLSEVTVQGGVTYQANRLAYDSHGRLRVAADTHASVFISYDANGNRSEVKTTIRNSRLVNGQWVETTNENATSLVTYTYDKVNRQKTSVTRNGVNAVVEQTSYAYDKSGHRISESVTNAQNVTANTVYSYDDLGRLKTVHRGGAMLENYDYDGAGRAVRVRSLVGDNGNRVQYRYDAYDGATGLISKSHVYVRDGADGLGAMRSIEDVYYGDNPNQGEQNEVMQSRLGYDAAGNLKGTRREGLSDPGNGATGDKNYDNRVVTFTTNVYNHNRNYHVVEAKRDEVRRGNPSEWPNPANPAYGIHTNVLTTYDGDGQVQSLHHPQASQFNRVFVDDAQGRALFVKQGTTDPAAEGHVQRQMIVNGEVLARYGEVSETTTEINRTPVYTELSEMLLGATPLGTGRASSSSHYVVTGGETLQSIARAALGDERLWYLIAEANGLMGGAELVSGQTLMIPERPLSTNASDTYRPYDPSLTLGDMSPALPAPPKNGCGGAGQIIMLVIAIVATVFTAGVAAVGLSGMANIMAAGASVLGGTAAAAGSVAATLGTFGTGVLAGAVGSIVSQGVGIAIGAHDKFSWKGVALSAIGSGISAGMGGWAPLGKGEGAVAFGNAVIRGAVGNAASQGIAVAAGLQSKFSWRGVAASAVGAGVGQAVGPAFGKAFGETAAGQFGARLASGLVAGTAAAVVRGGKVAMQQVAVDAFGNALGSSIAETSNGAPTTPAQSDDPLGAFIALNDGWSGVSARPTFAEDVAMRNAARNPMGLPTRGQMMAMGADAGNINGLDLPNDRVYGQYVPAGAEARGDRLLRGMRDREIDVAQTQALRAQADAYMRASAAQAATLTNRDDPRTYRSAGAGYSAAQASGLSYGGAMAEPVPVLTRGSTSEAAIDYGDAVTAMNGGTPGAGAFQTGVTATQLAKGAVGVVQLGAAGIYNQAVKIGGGLASIPYLLDGVDAAVAVQKAAQNGLGWTPQGEGVELVARTLAPVGEFVDKARGNVRNFSERHLGDGVTTLLGAGLDATFEIAGTVGGIRGVQAVADAWRIKALDPTTVSFTQSWVSYQKAGANYNFDTLVQSMRAEGWVGKPVDVVRMPDGTLTTIDNTRVLAARQAGINVEANVRGFDDFIADPVRRLSLRENGVVPSTWGDAATMRIAKPVQNIVPSTPNWSQQFPYGSLYDPAIKLPNGTWR